MGREKKWMHHRWVQEKISAMVSRSSSSSRESLGWNGGTGSSIKALLLARPRPMMAVLRPGPKPVETSPTSLWDEKVALKTTDIVVTKITRGSLSYLRSRRRRHGLRRGAEGVPPSEVTPDSPEEPSSLTREPLWRKLKDLKKKLLSSESSRSRCKRKNRQLTTNRWGYRLEEHGPEQQHICRERHNTMIGADWERPPCGWSSVEM